MGERGLELGFDLVNGLVQGRARGDIVAIGVKLDGWERLGLAASERVEFGNRLELIAEE